MPKKTTPADVQRDLLAVLGNTECYGCGERLMLIGESYCRPCGEAVNRLTERGFYFRDYNSPEWKALIAKERA